VAMDDCPGEVLCGRNGVGFRCWHGVLHILVDARAPRALMENRSYTFRDEWLCRIVAKLIAVFGRLFT
jgi:hypothetical protein